MNGGRKKGRKTGVKEPEPRQRKRKRKKTDRRRGMGGREGDLDREGKKRNEI